MSQVSGPLQTARQDCQFEGDVGVGVGDTERLRKRRRLNSPHLLLSTSSSSSCTALDSGYNSASDEEHLNKGLPTASSVSSHEQDSDNAESIEPSSSMRQGESQGQLRRRLNSEPTPSSHSHSHSHSQTPTHTPAAFRRKFASRVPLSQDLQRQERILDRRWSEPETSRLRNPPSVRNDRDADLEIIAAQHQIAVARQCLYGRNKMPSSTTATGTANSTTSTFAKKDIGCALPRINKATDVFGIFVDGCRVMDHERNFLSCLFNRPASPAVNNASAPATAVNPPTLSTAVAAQAQHNDHEQVPHFTGMVMPADISSDEPDFDTFNDSIKAEAEAEAEAETEADSAVSIHDIECFFNLDEASSPSEGECSV